MQSQIFTFYINLQDFGVGRVHQVYSETLLADSHSPETKQRSELAHPATVDSTLVPSSFERERLPSWPSPPQIGDHSSSMYTASARTAQGRNIQQLQVVFIELFEENTWGDK